MRVPSRFIIPLLSLTTLAATLLAAHAGAPPDFLEIKWGDSVEKAKAAMLSRPGCNLVSEAADKLVFSGGVFAGYPIEICNLTFTEGFSAGEVKLVTPEDATKRRVPLAIEQFNKLSRALTMKYGKFHAQKSGPRFYWQMWTWNVPDAKKQEQTTVNINLKHGQKAPIDTWIGYSRTITAKAPAAPVGKPANQPIRRDL